jgi:hypothetical protein
MDDGRPGAGAAVTLAVGVLTLLLFLFKYLTRRAPAPSRRNAQGKQLQRLLDQVLVVLGREEREEQRHTLLRSQQILKWIEVVRELGHSRHYDALQPLTWHRVLAGLVEHLVHEGRDALLEAIRGH